MPLKPRYTCTTPGMRICTKCVQERPLSMFHNHPKGPGGLSCWCRPCKREDRRLRRERGGITPGTAERFWSYVRKAESGCWLFVGGLTTEGYGRFFYDNRDTPSHHVPILLLGGKAPKYPMVCDHICRVKNCVNPDHLRICHQGVNTLENNSNPHARNAAKTHCKYGHPFSPENTKVIQHQCYKAKKRGILLMRPTRVCLACLAEKPQRVKERRASLPQSDH